MQDHKMAAAGELETSPRSRPRQETNSPEKDVKEFCAGALEFLETFTGKKLSEQEAKLWMERLAKYPQWKLLKLYEYTGGLTNEVFKFLDAIHKEPTAYRSLPEPERTPQHIQIARDFNEHIQKVLSLHGTREERIKWEMDSYKELDKKYPHLGVWEKVKCEKRFQASGGS